MMTPPFDFNAPDPFRELLWRELQFRLLASGILYTLAGVGMLVFIWWAR